MNTATISRFFSVRNGVPEWILALLWLFTTPVIGAQVDGEPVLAGDHPFAGLSTIPDAVDAVAVFNNPAESLMLSRPGQSVRSLLSAAGVFNHTEQAWGTLARAFSADTDETIRSLLGGRVVMVWDGIDTDAGSFTGLAREIDTRWALMCEVDQGYLGRIRTHLKPVKRDILRGRTLYAIEQGRYGIMLLDADAASGDPARVLLAPRGGTEMLELLLGSTRSADRAAGSGGDRSIMHGRSTLVRGLPEQHAGEDDAPWSVAWMVRLTPAENEEAAAEGPEPGRAMAGMLSLGEHGLRINFASDITPPAETSGDAPVELLDSLGREAVFALVSAQPLRVFMAGHAGGLSISAGSRPDPDAQPLDADDIFNGPALLMLSETRPDDAAPGTRPTPILTMLIEHPPAQAEDPAVFAERADSGMQGLIASCDPAGVPAHSGRFPGAVRTHRMRLTTGSHAGEASGEGPDPADDGATGLDAWDGHDARLSWASSDLGSSRIMAASLAPDGSDTAGQVRLVSDAALKLAAISTDDGSPSGVLMRGHLRPSRVVQMFGETASDGLGLSRLIEKISWDVRRAGFGIRGSVSLEFTSQENGSRLGGNRHE